MAVGNGRTDLVVNFNNKTYVLELKLKYDKYTIEEGKTQLNRYLDTLNQTEGWLMVFETKKSSELSWEDRIKWTETDFEGKKITIIEM